MIAYELTQDEVNILNNNINDEDQFMRHQLETLYPLSTPTPLKSLEQMMQDQQVQIDREISNRIKDIKMGVEYFYKEGGREEKEKLNDIFTKIASHIYQHFDTNKVVQLTDADTEFLEKLAQRKMENQGLAEASCMYRFILHVDPSYTYAWLGWANCEQDLDNLIVVQNIYTLAIHFLPNDPLLHLGAGIFYSAIQEFEKAKGLLNHASEEIEPKKEKFPVLYKQILDLLNKIILIGYDRKIV